MSPVAVRDTLTDEQVARLRDDNDDPLWSEIHLRYHGRLLAFAKSRVRDRTIAEEIVQETWMGLFLAIGRYDGRPMQKFLFGICSHKINDHFRRTGARPRSTTSIGGGPPSSAEFDPVISAPGPRTTCLNQEQLDQEVSAVRSALVHQIETWQQAGTWEKLKIIELLVVCGLPNKTVATMLDVTEQRVASVKHEFIQKIRAHIQNQDLPAEHFPELASPPNGSPST